MSTHIIDDSRKRIKCETYIDTCKHHGVTEFYVANGECRECETARARERYRRKHPNMTHAGPKFRGLPCLVDASHNDAEGMATRYVYAQHRCVKCERERVNRAYHRRKLAA